MNYEQTIRYLYSQLPMFSRIGAAAYKKDLHNTIELCNALHNPQTKFKSIHIAGTNGKGSVSHMLAAILQMAGYKTGLYTSPHLKDFRERIKINGEMIAKEFIVDFVEKNIQTAQEVQPSFFELTVAMAFDYFAKEQVDVAVIETGLGGRLDSTNIIVPVLSIITNIGYDHMNILGNTLKEIGLEKAGIIKPGVPVVISEYTEETKALFLNKASEVNAPVYFASEQFVISDIKYTVKDLTVKVTQVATGNQEVFTLDLNGFYQTKNLLAVLSAKNILNQQGFNITDESGKNGLANVKKLTGLHGRWDVISQDPTVVLDVAHNEDGIKQMLLSKQPVSDSKTHIVIGMVKDKDINKVLALLPKESFYYFTQAHIPRALPCLELKEKAAGFNLKGDSFENVNDALRAAKQKSDNDDLIIVCGSVFLIGEVDTNFIK